MYGNLSFYQLIRSPEVAKNCCKGLHPLLKNFLLSPKQGLVDFPNIRESYVLNVRLHLELSGLLNFLKLLFRQPIFEGVLLLSYHLLLILNAICLVLTHRREHAFWEGEPKVFGVVVDFESMIEFFNQRVGFCQ